MPSLSQRQWSSGNTSNEGYYNDKINFYRQGDDCDHLEALAKFYGGPVLCDSPEKSLLLAVLQDAIVCIQNGNASQRYAKLRDDALEWVRRTNDGGVCSFEHICDVFNFPIDATRRCILTDGGRGMPPDRRRGKRNRKPLPPHEFVVSKHCRACYYESKRRNAQRRTGVAA